MTLSSLSLSLSLSLSPSIPSVLFCRVHSIGHPPKPPPHTHALTHSHARTHAHAHDAHAHTHTHMHAHARTRTRTYTHTHARRYERQHRDRVGNGLCCQGLPTGMRDERIVFNREAKVNEVLRCKGCPHKPSTQRYATSSLRMATVNDIPDNPKKK